VQSIVVATSSQSKPIVTITKELEPIKGGAKLAIIPCTYLYPQNIWKYLLLFLALKLKL
jgi:hypothetical protein